MKKPLTSHLNLELGEEFHLWSLGELKNGGHHVFVGLHQSDDAHESIIFWQSTMSTSSGDIPASFLSLNASSNLDFASLILFWL